MVSIAEQNVVRSLRAILADYSAGADITRAKRLREVISYLEYFIPEVLCEIHQKWDHEGLDGVLPIVARKVGDRELAIAGHCTLISDQSLAPLEICLRLSAVDDVVSWLICKLDQRGERGMVRSSYYRSPSHSTKLLAVAQGRHFWRPLEPTYDLQRF
jgi:hypothetical protein